MATVFYFALNKFLSSNVSKMLANIWSGIENPNQSTTVMNFGGHPTVSCDYSRGTRCTTWEHNVQQTTS